MAIHSSEDFIYHLGNKLKEYQNSDGSIICKDDQTHDHWDHLEACIGLGIAGFKDEFERGLAWSRLNQNSDGSWYEEYKKSNPTKLNKQSNHAAYFATALAFHYILFKIKRLLKRIGTAFLWQMISFWICSLNRAHLFGTLMKTVSTILTFCLPAIVR